MRRVLFHSLNIFMFSNPCMENKSVNFPEIDLNNFPCIVKVENGDSILESN